MTDRAVNDLNYGHLGLSVYDPENQRWLFNRRPSPAGDLGLRIIDDRTPVATGSSPRDEDDNNETQSSPISYHKVVQAERQLLRRHPSLPPATHLFRPVLKRAASRKASTAVPYDPGQSELLAEGRIADTSRGSSSRASIRAIALPDGPAKSDLRIFHVATERCGWDDDRSIWLKASALRGGSIGWWVGEGAPILQVRFAQPLREQPALLAVRLPRTTIIFRPIFLPHEVPPKGARLGCRYPPSTIDANPILKLSTEGTSSEPHADLFFNPWYQRQLAVIDRSGKWSVFDLEGRHYEPTSFRATLFKTGSVAPVEEDSDSESNQGNESEEVPLFKDGWARIVWGGDANTIVVCNRQVIGIWQISGELEYSACVDFRKVRQPEWILDVKSNSLRPGHIFVLTTTRVLWYDILASDGGLKGESGPRSRMLVSWRHFRDTDDPSLRLSVTSDALGIVIQNCRSRTLLITEQNMWFFSIHLSTVS